MIIRMAEVSDLDWIAEISNRCFTDPWTRRGFEEALEQTSSILLVIEEEKAVIGYCCLYQVLDEGEIVSVGIEPTQRKKGYGAKMVQYLMKQGMDQGVEHFFLEVRWSNAAGRRLYESLGFEEDGVRKGFYENPKEDAVLMSWHNK